MVKGDTPASRRDRMSSSTHVCDERDEHWQGDRHEGVDGDEDEGRMNWFPSVGG